jgi:hypothetical protein
MILSPKLDCFRIASHKGPDLILSGSSTLTSTLLEHGLADEAGPWKTVRRHDIVTI